MRCWLNEAFRLAKRVADIEPHALACRTTSCPAAALFQMGKAVCHKKKRQP